MRELIERWIEDFLSEDNPQIDWVKPTVRSHGFLPLYLGWIAAIGIRPDGGFVQWDHDRDPTAVKALNDPYWQRMAICQGIRKYPELASLIPPRPAHAIDCSSCLGSGEIVGAPAVICVCGGLGWLIPDEARGPSPG